MSAKITKLNTLVDGSPEHLVTGAATSNLAVAPHPEASPTTGPDSPTSAAAENIAQPILDVADRPGVKDAWACKDPEGLPPMATWNLAGPRRKKQGRGGATALVTTVRGIIRCPLLYRVAQVFPRQKTGRPSPPAAYFLFYGQVARELRSFEAADQELLEIWEHVVVPEFAKQNIRLPAAKRHQTFNPIPGYAAFHRWRLKHLIEGGLIAQAIDANREAMLELGALIAVAEDRLSDDPLNPSLAQILTGDASVFQMASEIPEVETHFEDIRYAVYPGSRAVKGGARPDMAAGHYSNVKKHGPTDGRYHVALCTKGYSTYSRLIRDIAVAAAGQSESDAAQPLIDRTLSGAPAGYFQTLAYDGQIYPKHGLDILCKHGVYVTNHNAIKKQKTDHTDTEYGGYTRRGHGQYRNRTVQTHYTSLPTQRHLHTDGTPCLHHLVSDDGALYPADRAGGVGRPKKTGPVIPPRALHRTRTDPGYRVHLDYVIECPHGPLTYTVEITDTEPDKDGHISWGSKLAAHRVIPEAWIERFRAVFGARNQTESFFSWLEQRYFHKDRAASWGAECQLVDLFCSALLHNSEAWAHYAVGHIG